MVAVTLTGGAEVTVRLVDVAMGDVPLPVQTCVWRLASHNLVRQEAQRLEIRLSRGADRKPKEFLKTAFTRASLQMGVYSDDADAATDTVMYDALLYKVRGRCTNTAHSCPY